MKNTKKEVLRNCIPAMVCMVISGLNTIIDGLFIGRNIGEDGLAAINIAWPVPAFILASGIGIGVGCGINYVSALGKKHEKETLWENAASIRGSLYAYDGVRNKGKQ